MKLQYLGTAAAEGWPGMYCNCESCRRAWELKGKNIRTRSQSIVDDSLLIDFPPDTYLHILHYGLRLQDIHHLLITHTHEDHLYVDDLRWRGGGYCSDITGTLTLYGNDEMIRRMEAVESYDTETLRWKELTEFVPFKVMDYSVTAILAKHNPLEKCFLYHIERDGKHLFYGNDTGIFPDATWEYLRGKRFDLVSLDCTTLAIPEGTNHMGIRDVCEVRDRMVKIGAADEETQFVITHFSHNGRLLHDELVAIMEKHNFLVAYDGMSVEF